MVSIDAAVGAILALIHRWNLPQFLYNWQTLIVGVSAVLAAWRTIRATTQSADREVKASQAQTAVAQKQIETTLQLERQRDALRELDRTDRAEVIAFRLSGWLSEVGALIQTKSEEFDTLRKHNPVMPQFTQDIVNKLKLDAAVSIESAMSDLHYLKVGSGDVAQLDFFTRYFDAYLNRALRMTPGRGYSAGDLAVIYSHVGALQKEMQQLLTADRHSNPIVQKTATKRGTMNPRF